MIEVDPQHADAAHDRERLGPVAEGDGREVQAVGAGMLLDGQQLARDDVLPVGAPALDVLDLHAQQGQALGQLLGREVEVDELAEPGQGDSHRNAPRKRRSSSMYWRRSTT